MESWKVVIVENRLENIIGLIYNKQYRIVQEYAARTDEGVFCFVNSMWENCGKRRVAMKIERKIIEYKPWNGVWEIQKGI